MPVGKFAHSLCSLSRCEDNIHPAEQAYLLLLPPLRSSRRSCVQYLYISLWGFFFFLFFPRWQRLLPQSILVWHHNTFRRSESGALRLLMGRSPPTGSSNACIHSLLPFNPLSSPAPPPSLLFYISETSLHFMDPTPIHQPLLSHFCSVPLMCLFWTHHQNQDMGL